MSDELKLSPEEEIEHVKAVVEGVLQGSFGTETGTTASDFIGGLSTDPSKVDISVTSRSLYGRCGSFAYELQVNLSNKGMEVDIATSSSDDSNAHMYLIYGLEGKSEVIIDPSIGQFIEGHNNVFVGTRKQLRDIVLNQTGEGKKYRITHTRSKDNPQEAFERTWGRESEIR